MDGATEPPWTDLRRPPQPDPPRQPTDGQLSTLTLTLPWLVASAGAGRSPAETHPTMTAVTCPHAPRWRKSRS
ncbi:hypothetical protein D7Y28_21585 [Stenotrophomonas maltophilia]|nr:hypothetical protein [Stenotrophomonas maltophilia]